MFTLIEPTAVTLDNVQSRKEHHGDELVPAIDASMTLKAHNRVLDTLHPELREMLFTDRTPRDTTLQQGLELPVSELPNVRIADAGYPLKLGHEQQGARIEVAYGIGDQPGVVLALCKVHKFRVTPIEGGSVEVKFSASSSTDIDEHVIGLLSMLQQQEVSITLTMPEPKQTDIEDEPKDTRQTPAQAFAAVLGQEA